MYKLFIDGALSSEHPTWLAAERERRLEGSWHKVWIEDGEGNRCGGC